MIDFERANRDAADYSNDLRPAQLRVSALVKDLLPAEANDELERRESVQAQAAAENLLEAVVAAVGNEGPFVAQSITSVSISASLSKLGAEATRASLQYDILRKSFSVQKQSANGTWSKVSGVDYSPAHGAFVGKADAEGSTSLKAQAVVRLVQALWDALKGPGSRKGMASPLIPTMKPLG